PRRAQGPPRPWHLYSVHHPRTTCSCPRCPRLPSHGL
ncbi:hypothetical protein BN1708_018693, partial [Verticillium longisporum]